MPEPVVTYEHPDPKITDAIAVNWHTASGKILIPADALHQLLALAGYREVKS